MNVILKQKKPEGEKRRKALYITILVICLLSILISAYMLVFKNYDTTVPSEHIPASEEEYLRLEEDFENIFSNKIINETDESILITNKIKKEDDIIGYSYENKEKVTGKYSLDVKIPFININNNVVKKYNNQIEQIFKQKALEIINDTNSKDTIYTVDYVAYINENNILSIAIRSILKEGENAQRTIIQTYNYDFQHNKEVSLEKMLTLYGLEKEYIENKVENRIKQEQAKVEELKKLGYNIYERDYTSDIYKIENTKEFFIGQDGFLYLIYAYGNENYTSELDLVIF